jgi:hypothetical protein
MSSLSVPELAFLLDGEVVEGSADVDESIITGESRSVSKAPGGKVIAGTVAAGGSLRVRITAVGEQTEPRIHLRRPSNPMHCVGFAAPALGIDFADLTP